MKKPSLIDRIFNPDRFRESVKANMSFDELRLEYVSRTTARSSGNPKILSNQIKGNAVLFTPKTIADWNSALVTATDPETPNLSLLAELYDNLLLDSHTRSIIETRVNRVTRSKFKVVNDAGEENEELTELLQRPWFMEFLKAATWSHFTGVKVVELFETDQDGELTTMRDLPMGHLLPWRGEIAKELGDDKGFPYLKGGMSRYYLQIGASDHIGELYKMAPLILAKKLSMGSWLNYVEKYGIDPRVAFTNNYTQDRENKLMQMLLNLKSADIAVLQEGERLESIGSTDKDAYQIFKELLATLNDELSKAVLGQAGTVDAKEKTGTYGSMQVMQEVSEDRHESDRMFVRHLVNKDLLPKIIGISSFYSGFANHHIEWDDSEEMSVEQVSNLVVNLTNAGYELDLEEINERLPVTITGYRNTLPGALPGKNKPNAIAAQFAAYYKAQGIGQDVTFTPQAASLKTWKETILAVAKQLHDGKITVNDLSDEMIQLIYEELEKATVEGLGKTYDEEDDKVPNDKKATARKVKGNVYRFAAAKNYAENVEMSNALLDEDGKMRSWTDFKKEVEKINETFNRNYLQAEYQTARRSGQAIRQWEEFQENADLFPNLEYRTVGDQRVRDDHDDLDGIIKPLDDPFWDQWYPPNGFRCRCGVRQTESEPTKGTVKTSPDKGFKQHVGKTLEVFNEEHPAFVSLPKDVAKDIEQRLKDRDE
jgi:SPP1 gp7 family putative phage head morphogenesis protein